MYHLKLYNYTCITSNATNILKLKNGRETDLFISETKAKTKIMFVHIQYDQL